MSVWDGLTPWLAPADIALLRRDEASGNFTPDMLLHEAKWMATYRLWDRAN